MKARAALAALAAFLVALVTASASAAATTVTSRVDTDEVELGDTFAVVLEARSEGESADDPQLGAHPGVTVVDTGAMPTHMVSIVNGRRSETRGLVVTWTLRADRVGTFAIGPPSVATPSGRKSAPAQRIVVVPRGKATHPRQRGGAFDPFDPFGSLGRPRGGRPDPFKGLFPSDDDDDNPFLGAVTGDPSLALPEARGPVAFLHATIDKTRAVIGEQVTLNVYLYEDPHARAGQPSDVHEATATDFVKRSLLQDETRTIGLGHAIVGGRPWSVKLVRKNALFPLKAGRLSILPMSLTLPQARVGLRESETLTVIVSEPPPAGRPAGYQIGDVGDFSLSATVAPRTTPQGGAVGVTVELRGTGNMPAELPLPTTPGTEWLEPQTKDALGALQNDRFGGTRTFSYVVRLRTPGAIDLGEVRLPYYDPATRAYAVAHAGIGIVDVTPGAVRDAGGDAVEEVLPGMPDVRSSLEGSRRERFLTERTWLWALLFGAPLLCGLVMSAQSVVRRMRARRAAAAPAAATVARDRRALAEAALRGKDGAAAVSAIARALEATILAETSVNVRGASGEAALRELAAAGVSEEAAREVSAVLHACEDARFSPAGVSIEDARAIFERAERATVRVRATRGEA